jgi:hypothetical protein
VVTPENKTNAFIKHACAGLASLLNQFESWRMEVVPFICFNIIIFATIELLLLESVVTSESVNYSFVMNSREERLFYRHRASSFYLPILVH